MKRPVYLPSFSFPSICSMPGLSLALSLGSTETNLQADEFGFDLVLKMLISIAFVIPLIVIRWWRVFVLLCTGMSGVVAWNTIAVLKCLYSRVRLQPLQHDTMSSMKILALDGSPNMERGNTALLLERFLIGAIDAGGEVERFATYAMQVQRCEAKMKCWYSMPGVCIHNDDVSRVLDLLSTSDLLVLSTPVHVGGMTEGMVRLMERVMPLLSPYFEVGDDGRTRHVLSPDAGERKLVLVSTCGYYEEEAFDPIVCQAKDLSRSLGRRFAGALIRPHGLALKFMQAAGYDVDDVLQSAEDAGRELVGEGEMREATLAAVRRQLMTQDQFVTMMNSAFDKRLGCQPGRTPGCS